MTWKDSLGLHEVIECDQGKKATGKWIHLTWNTTEKGSNYKISMDRSGKM